MLSSADIQPDGDDLVVRWSEPETVTITVGPSPDELGPLEVTADGSGAARVVGVASSPRRHYARLEAPDGSAIVAAERRLPMEGVVNFRDLGGYVTGDGRRVRWDRVYRSDSLERLTNDDIEALEPLGVRLVCDLRRDEGGPSRRAGFRVIQMSRSSISRSAASPPRRRGCRTG
jgi:hypothetical protein